jgi:Transmembrane domain of unknown function (DUF3566)
MPQPRRTAETIENPTQPDEQSRPDMTPPRPPASAAPSAPAPAPAAPSATPPTTTGAATFAARAANFRPTRRVAPKPTRRTRVVIRQIGPWSVLKFSLLFYFCVMLIVYFALAIIYLILSAAGAMDSLSRVLGYVFGSGTSTLGPQRIPINGGAVFTWLFIAGCVFVVVWSLVNVFVAFLYNLISDIVGGIEVTLADRSSR